MITDRYGMKITTGDYVLCHYTGRVFKVLPGAPWDAMRQKILGELVYTTDRYTGKIGDTLFIACNRCYKISEKEVMFTILKGQ